LDERQLARLEVLEKSTLVTGMQAGEARFYALRGTPGQPARAERVVAPGEQLLAAQREQAERLKQTPVSQSMDDAAASEKTKTAARMSASNKTKTTPWRRPRRAAGAVCPRKVHNQGETSRCQPGDSARLPPMNARGRLASCLATAIVALAFGGVALVKIMP
jgi:hypothetical protein